MTGKYILLFKTKFMPFITRWFFSTNHKDIGTLYFFFGLIAGLMVNILFFIIRIQLILPGYVLINYHTYNIIVTAHFLILIIFILMPLFIGGLGNWFVPLLVGAQNMALPRLNNFSFWLLPSSFFLVFFSVLLAGGPVGTGCTLISLPLFPLTIIAYFGTYVVDLVIIFSIYLAGLSLLFSALNIIVTVFNLRIKGTYVRLLLYTLSLFFSAILSIIAIPVLILALSFVLYYYFDTIFFGSVEGDNFFHLFWFFDHSGFYILILPDSGIINHFLTCFPMHFLGLSGMLYLITQICFIFIIYCNIRF